MSRAIAAFYSDGWLHESIRAHAVKFFFRHNSDKCDFANPYLTDFEFSRPVQGLTRLSPQAVEVLHAAYRLSGGLPYLFPSERHVHKPISENTLRALLIRAGYYQRHVPHGFRAAFSTYMNERADRAWREAGHKDASPDRAIIDLMLAHVPGNKVEGAYNRAAYLPRRRELAGNAAARTIGVVEERGAGASAIVMTPSSSAGAEEGEHGAKVSTSRDRRTDTSRAQ